MKKTVILLVLSALLAAGPGCRGKIPSGPDPDIAVPAGQTEVPIQDPDAQTAHADPGTAGTLVEVRPQSFPGYGISLRLPESWTYQVYGAGEPIVGIRPEGAGAEGEITLRHDERFGVCGTGLEQKEILFNGHKALQGFYDGQERWSFIVLDAPENGVIINSAGDWFPEYEEEIGQILSTVQFVYYGEDPGARETPGTVSPSYLLDCVAEWARLMLDFSRTGPYDMTALFGTEEAQSWILDHEALVFDDGTVAGYCTFTVPQWITAADGEESAYGDGMDLVDSLIRGEADRLGKDCYVDGGTDRAFFIMADENRIRDFAGFYMNALSGSAPDSVSAAVRTIRANYTEDSGIVSGCLNADRMARSSVRHCPVFKLDTIEDLEGFRTRFREVLTPDPEFSGMDEYPWFPEAAAGYDAEFFADHTLLLAYVAAGSGSYRFSAWSVTAGGTLCRMDVIQTNHPEVVTADMEAWFVIAEIPDSEVRHCTEFDARLVG